MVTLRRRAFTLIELLVVIAVIGVLMALLLPAINAVRGAAQRTQCQSNMKQLGLAFIAYAQTNGVLPPGQIVRPDRLNPGRTLLNGWSAQSRILPYMEGQNRMDMFNLELPYDNAANTTAGAVVMTVFLCPSDINSERHRLGSGYQNINYGVNRGDWYVFGGFSPTDNAWAPNFKRIADANSPFGVNSSVGFEDIYDGVSKTVLMAEVKTFVPYFRKCSDLIFAPVDYNKPAPLPDVDPSTITQYRGCANGEFKDASHTEFHDGGVHQTGFTTAFPPNTRTGGANGSTPFADMDVVGIREREGGPTFAAVTARSHHSGGVNVCFGDGSVQFIGDGIDGMVWRALGSIAGSELISANSY